MLLMKQRVAVGSEPNEPPADERQLVDRDPPTELGVGERLERRVGVRGVAQVLEIQLDREGIVDRALSSRCPAREGGPVDLVARDDLAQRPLERRDVELPVQPDDRLELVGDRGRVEVVEEADLL